MTLITLTDSTTGSTARLAPQLGFNVFEFIARVRDWSIHVLDAEPAFPRGTLRPSGHGIPILFPFPNRIRDARFVWEGREYIIAAETGRHDKTGNAIHGFCLDRPWRVIEQGDRFAVGRFQLSVDAPERRALWPADFVIEVRYELRGSTLRADIRIENPDSVPLPWGFGTHPYFRLPLDKQSQPARCLIQVPADSEWILKDCLPTGERRPVTRDKDLREGEYFDVLTLDDVLTDIASANGVVETVIIDEAAGLQVTQRCDPTFREMVVFTPPNRSCVCIEPYTCVTDAINLQARGINTGLRVLPPGGQTRLWFEISSGTLLC
ncbi:MAG TPA: aldose 1-epimerase [Planctomycetaceae bacterium]|nr:aldose 1-epimerase [Planctomycetaceae bacterium]